MKCALSLLTRCTLPLVLVFSCAAATPANTHPVRATIAGVEVSTQVDSIFARQLLSGKLPAAQSAVLRSRLTCTAEGDLPTVQELQGITRDYSTDTATAALIDCLSSVPRIQRSQQLFLSELALQRDADPHQAAFLAARAREYLVLIVPGWGYQSNAHETGADLAGPRGIITSLGFENHLVEIEDTGSVEAGAGILVATINRYLQSTKKIILVSASSGGPIVALALSNPAIANHPQLTGWLNICGVLRGAPVIDMFLHWPRSLLLHTVAWYEGWNYSDVVSLSRRQSTPRYEQFTPPAQLTIVNYIGIPFSGQVSELGSDFYGMLKAQGPNDGLTLIPDALAPGYTVMAVGMDHFVNNDPEIALKTAALVPVMLKLIED